MPSMAGVIWAVAIWDGLKIPISQIAEAVNEMKVRKKQGFLYIDFIFFLVDDICALRQSASPTVR